MAQKKNSKTSYELSNELKAEIHRRVDLRDVLRDMYGVQVRERGNIRCPLPSHDGVDRNPSFSIYDRAGQYYWRCYSEGKGGDMFALVQHMEPGTSFPDAMIKIAKHFGIDCSEYEKLRDDLAKKPYRRRKSKKEAPESNKETEQTAKQDEQPSNEGAGSNPAKPISEPSMLKPIKSTFISLEDAQEKFGWTVEEWQAKKVAFDAKHEAEQNIEENSASEREVVIAEKYKGVEAKTQRVRDIAKAADMDKDVLLVLLQNDDSPLKDTVKSGASMLKAEQVEVAVSYLSSLVHKEEERARAAEAIIAEAEAIVDSVAAPKDELKKAAEKTAAQERLPLVEHVDINHDVGENGLPVVPRKTVIVNLLGGPGSGKSTLAHEVTSELKKAGFTVGFVSEYASEMIRDGRADELKDGSLATQQEIFVNQVDRTQAYMGKVDFIVTESPTILSMIYLQESGPACEEFKQCVRDEYRSSNNFTCMVKRGEEYIQDGRVQDAQGALEVDDKIRTWMREEHIKGTYNRDAGQLIAQNAARYYGTLHGIDVRTHSELIEDLKPPQGAWNCLKVDAMHAAEIVERSKPSFARLSPRDQEARVDEVKADAVARVASFQKQGALPSQARLMVDGIRQAADIDTRRPLSAQIDRAKSMARAAARQNTSEKTQRAKQATYVER